MGMFSGFVHAIGGRGCGSSLLFCSKPAMVAPAAAVVFILILICCAVMGSQFERTSAGGREEIRIRIKPMLDPLGLAR